MLSGASPVFFVLGRLILLVHISVGDIFEGVLDLMVSGTRMCFCFCRFHGLGSIHIQTCLSEF